MSVPGAIITYIYKFVIIGESIPSNIKKEGHWCIHNGPIWDYRSLGAYIDTMWIIA